MDRSGHLGCDLDHGTGRVHHGRGSIIARPVPETVTGWEILINISVKNRD